MLKYEIEKKCKLGKGEKKLELISQTHDLGHETRII
jgi:hypothetical protein